MRDFKNIVHTSDKHLMIVLINFYGFRFLTKCFFSGFHSAAVLKVINSSFELEIEADVSAMKNISDGNDDVAITLTAI